MNTTTLFNWRFDDDAHAISIRATAYQRSSGDTTYIVARLNTLIDIPLTATRCATVEDALALARKYLDIDRKVLLAYLA